MRAPAVEAATFHSEARGAIRPGAESPDGRNLELSVPSDVSDSAQCE